MRIIKYPAIYKHFRNKLYATMNLSKSKDFNEIIDLTRQSKLNVEHFKAFHTELDCPIDIYKVNDTWYHKKNDDLEDLILYKSLYDNTGIYARPASMFASEVDKITYPDIKQKYRFELVNIS